MTSVLGGDVATQNWGGNPASKIGRLDTSMPSVEDYVNVFGPSAYNMVPDGNRNKKLGRVQMPDVIKVHFGHLGALFFPAPLQPSSPLALQPSTLASKRLQTNTSF